MPRHINCPNGHLLSVAAEHEGMTLRCPTCQAIFTIRLLTVVEVVEEVPALAPPPPPPPPLPTPSLPPPTAPLPVAPLPAAPPVGSMIEEGAQAAATHADDATRAELPTLDVTVLEGEEQRPIEDALHAELRPLEVGPWESKEGRTHEGIPTRPPPDFAEWNEEQQRPTEDAELRPLEVGPLENKEDRTREGIQTRPPPLDIADLSEEEQRPTDAIQARPPPLDAAAWEDEAEHARADRRAADDEDEDDERPRRRKRRRAGSDDDESPAARGRLVRVRKTQQRQYAATRVGLLCYYWKFILYVGAILLVLLSFILTLFNAASAAAAVVREDPRGLQGATAFQAFIGIITFLGLLGTLAVAPILGIVGGAFCVRVPLKTRARGLAIATLVLDSIPVGCGVLMVLTGAYAFGRFDPAVGYLSQALMIIAALTTLAGFILFMIFLRTVAESENDIGTAREAMSLMRGFLFTWIGGPILILLSARLLIHLLCIGVLLLLAMVLGWFALVLKQLFGILAVILFVRARI